MIHITGTTAVPIPACAGIRIMINTGFTGTITLVDGAGVTQSIITNPVTGNNFQYYGLVNSVASPATVTASAVGDFTVNVLSRTMS